MTETPTSILELGQEHLKRIAEKRIRDMGADGDQFTCFEDYVNFVKPSYQWAPHHRVKAKIINAVTRDEIDRVMISEPPRHGKSETVSRMTPGYYLRKHPERNVGLTSYGADLAWQLNRDARDYFVKSGGRMDKSGSSVKHWLTIQGGGCWASGARGPITGRGMNLGIIDDPFKDEKQAASLDMRNEVYSWYKSTFYTRLENPGAMILMFTRWHEDDLQGRLLQEEQYLQNPEAWIIVRFEAIKTSDPFIVPDSCAVEVDDRSPGAPLWPEKYPLGALERIQEQLGGRDGYEWLSLYQQAPRAREGSFFKDKWFDIVDGWPDNCDYVRGWDTANTEGGGDWTVGVLMARDRETGIYYIVKVDRFQHSSGRRDTRMRYHATQDREHVGHVVHDIEQEPAGAGKAQFEGFVKTLSGFSVTGSTKTQNSEVYCDAFRSQCEYGNVKLVRGDWNKPFLDEMTSFPKGRHDDQVIAATRAFNNLSNITGLQIAVVGRVPLQV